MGGEARTPARRKEGVLEPLLEPLKEGRIKFDAGKKKEDFLRQSSGEP